MKVPAICLALVSVCLLMQFSCRDKDCTDPWNPDCDNYNPCLYQRPVSADFKMEEEIYPFTPSDTIIAGSYVLFTALHDLDSLDWRVGQDTNHHWNQKNFELLFNSVFGTLDVRLIGKRKPNHACFPFDDGVDTVVKHLTVVSRSSSQVLGRYHGNLLSNPADTFTIEIKDSVPFTVLKNLPNGCTQGIIDVSRGYKQFNGGSSSSSCAGWNYYGHLRKGNSEIVVTYEGLVPGPVGQQTFVGKRIQ